MGNDFRFWYQVETRRLIWLTGIVFAMVLVLQYFELPGNLISSIFTIGKAPIVDVGSSQIKNSSVNSQMADNLTLFNSSNSSGAYAVHELGNYTETAKEQEKISSDSDTKSEGNEILDKTLGSEQDTDPEDESPSKDFLETNTNSSMDNVGTPDYGSAPEKAGEPEFSISFKNVSEGYNSSLSNTKEDDKPPASQRSASSNTDLASPSPALRPISLSPNLSSPTEMRPNSIPPAISDHSSSLGIKDAPAVLTKDENPGPSLRSNESSMSSVPVEKKMPKKPTSTVITVSEMYKLLRQSRASYHSMKPRWSSAVDKHLQYARSQIVNAPIINDHNLYPSIYRNVSMFRRSYELMEQTLKVYIYREGKRPVFHQPPIKGIYASEGWFMKLLEANKHFVTKKPREAHLFYLPFSSRMLEETLYVRNSHRHDNLIAYLKNYVDMIVAKYPFWNRTGGADHFLVACHDWAPAETGQYMANCIRALCNNDIKSGFVFGKDVSLPETYVRSPQNLLRDLGGKPPSKRPILAFFAGQMHGYVRPILLQNWENKDPDMKIFGPMPKVKGKMNYVQHMKSSKYCICAKGYEVNSPRVVEAIFYECVPVIISDNFVPPFFEILNWESFAVFVLEKDIPNLKKILLSIPRKRYLEMQGRVKKVQQHFLWHARPVKYDIFHMILHSVWYTRVFSMTPR